jgi:MFS family permease
VIALMVGLLTFPLSLLADRWGRVKSLVLMAFLWSLATLACGISQNFHEMLLARLFVGVGEAAYGSVGVAVVLSVFPSHMRSTLTGAFMAGGMFGSVLGIASGGILAAHFGWRWAFGGMALFGLALAMVYLIAVRPNKIEPHHAVRSGRDAALMPLPAKPIRSALSTLVSTRSVVCAYVGSGLQLFIGSAVMAWMPSYLNRYYALPLDRAGVAAAAFVLTGAIGMILCGVLSDRLGRLKPVRKVTLVIWLCLISSVLLSIAFSLPTGRPQLLLIAIGMLFAVGSAGPAGAMVANLTNPSVHGSAFATLTLANNLLGLAPAPFLTGMLADRLGLQSAFQFVPLIGLVSAAVFWIARRNYLHDLAQQRLTAVPPSNPPSSRLAGAKG